MVEEMQVDEFCCSFVKKRGSVHKVTLVHGRITQENTDRLLEERKRRNEGSLHGSSTISVLKTIEARDFAGAWPEKACSQERQPEIFSQAKAGACE